jgi:hypothetical protein
LKQRNKYITNTWKPHGLTTIRCLFGFKGN